ncbi:Abi family protein [Dyadobacter bucti]|uniref:Abi family protein n=1 Tax=Dyadobacter bucti TaxID=2572203 RepID=UPI003F70B6E6
MNYSKHPFRVDQHLQLLIQRGLHVPDHERAKKYLSNIGYYRLTGYMHHLQYNDGSHSFRENVKFDDVVAHYHFDKELRILLSDYLARIEVALRARLIDKFSIAHGFYWYQKEDLYVDKNVFRVVNEEIQKRFNQTQEQFVRSFKLKYINEKLPPCNMGLELLSFGKLSKLYEGLKNDEEKQNIAEEFKLVSKILSSWLRHLTNVRNVCAHHSRLWNRRFTADQPQIPSRKAFKFPDNVPNNFNSTLYGVISIMNRLLEAINPGNAFIKKMLELIEKFPGINLHFMGFPDNWREAPAWKL